MPTKFTFYADDDIVRRLKNLDSGTKSNTINKLLREGFRRGASTKDKLQQLETRLALVESQLYFDGYAINSIRQYLVERSGGKAANEMAKAYNDLLHGGDAPRRDHWEPEW